MPSGRFVVVMAGARGGPAAAETSLRSGRSRRLGWARRALRRVLVIAGGLAWGALAAAQTVSEPVPLPTFAALEAAGATIGAIRILNREIFDTSDPEEDYLLFRWANDLHIQTRPEVIEGALLFKTGDRVSTRVLEETERLLRNSRYVYEVQFRPVAVHDGVVDIEVLTRDTWSLDLGISASRSGGENSTGLSIREYNLFGTGTAVSFGYSSNVDRSGSEFALANERVAGSWTAVRLSHASNSDGRRDAASVVRPFYALDTRWAAGLSASRDDRIEAVYNAGNVVSEYRHRQARAEAFGGWSRGLIDGWVRRVSAGVSFTDETFANEPGRTAPEQLAEVERLVGPFVRYQLIEDFYQKELNRNLIGKPEFFAMGLAATAQLGWASTALGSSRNALLYAGSVSRGFEPAPQQTLMAAARLAGQWSGGQVRSQRLGVETQYYLPRDPHRLFYAAASADLMTNPEPNEALLLGGDTGLRGYPLRYQSGTRRALFTVEERIYTDLYLWRLFRIGGAAFFDTGRAWGGDNTNTANPGWLSDLGVGLRIVSTRSAFGNVLHLDIAVPMNTTPDMEKVQFLVTTKASF